MSYDEYKQSLIKYPKGTKCFVCDCNNEALYEGGDARFYCAMCEECLGLEKRYRNYLIDAYGGFNVQELTNNQIKQLIDKRRERLLKAIKDLEEMQNGREFGET